MVKLVNRAKMTITAVASSGTGALTLGAASAGFQTFAAAGVSNGDIVRYTIEGPNAGDFEIGSGIYTSSGTTLSRTPTESSNSNNAITATTDSVVFVTAAAVDLGPTLHSDINGLIAQTGMTVGDTALVTGTNKLYMYTAAGWFLIATVSNAAPSAVSGAAANYTLANDATASVITLAATDPEGFPITFSHTVSTGSLGSTATVSQGTGASANVFTVTPSSNSAHAGTFSLTFSASDGSNVSQAISAFSLAFDPWDGNIIALYDAANYSSASSSLPDQSGESGPAMGINSSVSLVAAASGLGGVKEFAFTNVSPFRTTSSLGSTTTVVLIMRVPAGTSSTSTSGYWHSSGLYYMRLLHNAASADYTLFSGSNQTTTASLKTPNSVVRSSTKVYLDGSDITAISRAGWYNSLSGTSTKANQYHSLIVTDLNLGNGFDLASTVYFPQNAHMRAIAFYDTAPNAAQIANIHAHWKDDYSSNSHMAAHV